VTLDQSFSGNSSFLLHLLFLLRLFILINLKLLKDLLTGPLISLQKDIGNLPLNKVCRLLAQQFPLFSANGSLAGIFKTLQCAYTDPLKLIGIGLHQIFDLFNLFRLRRLVRSKLQRLPLKLPVRSPCPRLLTVIKRPVTLGQQ